MNPAEGTSHQELLKFKPSLYQFEKEIGIINQKADCRQKQKQPKLMFEPLDRRNHTFICCKHQQKEREQISSYRYGISQISQRENEIRQPSLNSGIKKKEHFLFRGKTSCFCQVNSNTYKHNNKAESHSQQKKGFPVTFQEKQDYG